MYNRIYIIKQVQVRGARMIKNYVIDTNVMIHDPDFFMKFDDNNVIIPIPCIEELDSLKNREGLVGFQARNTARELQKLRMKTDESLHAGIRLESGGTLRIELNHMDPNALPDAMDFSKNDTRILAITKNIQASDNKHETILVTKDLYMAIKADALGIKVQDYENDKIKSDKLYCGYQDAYMPSQLINKVYRDGLALQDFENYLAEELFPNEFIHLHSTDDDSHEMLSKYKGGRLVPMKYSTEHAWGLFPINREQKMAFELLMDPDIEFVTLAGGAGSGKTILSTAVALQKVLEFGAHRKIVFVRPVVPAGTDIGFLPGTEKEKLRPWMGSFYDAIENILTNRYTRLDRDKKTSKKYDLDDLDKPAYTVDDFIEMYAQQGIIETKTFTYMRGRTLSDAMVIVDEAQEITPHLSKLMLTRAGFGSKFVFIGDPSDNQIDNVLVDARSNGLVYTVEKMKSFDITGHVTLKQVERSPLAKIAEKYM
jgi:PhoH-like ATPase